MWVIYREPSDYPGLFVVRKWTIYAGAAVPDEKPKGVRRTLEAARQLVPAGAWKLGRAENDDPCIEEVWV